MTVPSMLCAVPLGGNAVAADLTCAGSAVPRVCAEYSRALIDVMEVVSPGAATAFAQQLATGYRLDTATTVTCALGESCDAWPVAVEAATIAGSPGTSCGLGDANVCGAVNTALSGTAADSATAEIANLVPRVAAAPANDRAARLGVEVADAIARLGGSVNGQPIADALVGIIVLAVNLTPATSPGTAIAPGTAPTGATVDNGDSTASTRCSSDAGAVTARGASGTLVDAGVQAATCLATATDPVTNCMAMFDTFNTLNTWAADTWTQFEIEATAGISRREWVYPKISHTGCAPPTVRFTGTIFAEAESNGGSSLASKRKRSDRVTVTSNLYLNSHWSAASSVLWDTTKVDVDYVFPVEFVIHDYAPPIGNYYATADGHAELLNGYVATNTGNHYRDFDYVCDKYGDAEAVCDADEQY